jgi:hypothetical protein
LVYLAAGELLLEMDYLKRIEANHQELAPSKVVEHFVELSVGF